MESNRDFELIKIHLTLIVVLLLLTFFSIYSDNSILFILVFISTIALLMGFFFDATKPNLIFFRKLQINDINVFLCVTYFYFLLWALTISTIYLFLSNNEFFNSEIDVFQVFVQIQATFLAIIFAVIAILVQLNNTTYSPIFGDFFKSLKEWKIVLIIYFISMSINIFLSIIKESIDLANYIAFTLTFFCILILIPFIWNTITSLRPENIIQYLTHQIQIEEERAQCEILIQLFHGIVNKSEEEKWNINADREIKTLLQNLKGKKLDYFKSFFPFPKRYEYIHSC